MTIYNITNVLTGLIEAIMMIMICEAFCTKRENFESHLGTYIFWLMSPFGSTKQIPNSKEIQFKSKESE